MQYDFVLSLDQIRGNRARLRLLLASLLAALNLAQPLYSQTGNAMVPFAMDYAHPVTSSSPADVSFLLNAPAGKGGFLRVVNGHLATGNGRRIRLWGVNITDWSKGSRQIPEKKDAAFWASILARFGVNCVRFQFLDIDAPRGLLVAGKSDTRSIDPDQMDREDYFIAELEKRGIYIDFNLLVGRPFKTGDGVDDASTLHEGAKGTSLFDHRLIELQKEYAQQLLTHRNPYTGRSFSQDSAVALVEINNENALNIGFRPPSPFYAKELTGMYNQWLAAHRTTAEIDALRTVAGVNDGHSPVPLMFWKGQAASAPSERFDAEAAFYNDVQRSYFVQMQTYLRQTLGVRSLILDTADHSHSESGYPILMATSDSEVVDGHTYWQHPEMYVHKSPMVDDPFNSTVVELSRSAILNKPYTVSEVNNPFPSEYDSEGIPILAAYGALQDWDAILWYTFEPKLDKDWAPYVGDPFDISQHPVKMPELAAGALMFVRGDVRTARAVVARTYTGQQVFDSMLLPASDRPYFTPGFPLQLPLEEEMRIGSFDGPETQRFSAGASADPIRSDTGELAWYHSGPQTGLVTVDTARTQVLIGFLNAHSSAESKADTNLAAEVENAFCMIQISSLDNRPIARSTRMLLVTGGPVENSGERWNAVGTAVTNWGGSPTRIEPVRGTLILRHLDGARAVQIEAMDGAGQPIGSSVSAVRKGDEWRVPLGKTVTTWYVVTVRR